MDAQVTKTLTDGGIELQKTLKRFMGNEDLFLKYFKLFTDDPSMRELEEAIREKNHEAASLAVHTLKGTAGNLGMTGLYDVCVDMLACYRDMRPNDGDSMLGALRIEYDRVLAIIDKI